MSLSIQTNVASLDAQDAIRVNTQFQNNTIEQLSSGYRINSSADDAAGLAVANQYAASTAELTQGVLNATNGTSALQIVDGGLSNITTILNRLTTLATESASSTFTGNRTTLNNEYQGLLSEINRQASNVGLNTGGTNNANLTTFIGGGSNASNAQVDVNLSGTQNAVDSKGLGISTTSILGGGAELSGNAAAVNTVNLSNTATVFLAGQSQVFNFNIGVAGPSGVIASQAEAITVTGGTSGLSGDQVISSLNSSLSQYGISASIAGDGTLQFGGTANFSVAAAAASGGNAVATALSQTTNTSNYNVSSLAGNGAAVVTGISAGSETLLFQNGAGTTSVTLNSTATSVTGSNGVYTGLGSSIGSALTTINTALNGTGISAVEDALGTSISFQSSNVFSLSGTTSGETGNILGGAGGAVTVTGPTSGSTGVGNSIQALAALATAGTNLGLTQGTVGAGINKLNYATNLAQSQITNYSAAESGIKDANIAAEAANLTKAQVLQQASLAALAQANSSPQALLKLLQ